MDHDELENIYGNIPVENIPWIMADPPDALVDLITSGAIKPCKAIDFGSGNGNYALYLSGMGFEVTGIDISISAVKIAKENARKKGIKCNFLAADVSGELNEIEETYDFAYDWDMLHHVFPENRKKYVENVHRILNPGGKYLSVCFSEEDPQFGGSGKYRKTQLGTILYFSSESELKELFDPYFNILELKSIEIKGKSAHHIAIFVFMMKR